MEPQETEYGHRSTSAMVTGIVLTSTGGAALIGGFFFALLNGFMVEGGNETAETAGAVMMGTGAAGILIGVPLTVYGAQDDTSRYDSGGEPRVQLAISPTSVGLHGRF